MQGPVLHGTVARTFVSEVIMSSQPLETGGCKIDKDIIILYGLLLFCGVTLVAAFLASCIGLLKQLANPATTIEFDRSIIVATAFPLFIFAFLMTPELRPRPGIRRRVAIVAALSGMIICGATTAALVLSIARPSPFTTTAASYLLFVGSGFFPALVVARVYVFYERDAQVARRGDHFIDTTKLSPEMKRLVEKHTNGTMKAPPAWRPLALFGNTDTLTHDDLRKILTTEEAEEKQIAELHHRCAVNARNERAAAHYQHIQCLPPQEKALFESKLRADVEALQGLREHRAKADREVAQLKAEIQRIHAAHAETVSALRGEIDRRYNDGKIQRYK